MIQKPLKKRLVDFLSDNAKELEEIYEALPDQKKTTIRGRLNENIGKCFKRVAKGVYVATNGSAQAVIIEGDAWEKLKDFADNSVDTIITDSPYTCLDKHYQVGSTRQRNLNKSIGFETKDIDMELLKSFKRVLKPGGHFFSFMPADGADTYKYTQSILDLSVEAGFEFNKRMIWDRMVIGLGYNGRNRYEQILFFSKGKRHMPYDMAMADVLTFKRVPASQRIHNAEKPVDLIKSLLVFSTKPGEVALDAFAGSLTLAAAGQELGINTISIELDKDMIEKSIKARKLNVEMV